MSLRRDCESKEGRNKKATFNGRKQKKNKGHERTKRILMRKSVTLRLTNLARKLMMNGMRTRR
jgi:hypothetical protein